MEKDISIVDGILVFRLTGEYSYPEMLKISDVIGDLCQTEKVRLVLLDLVFLDGFLESGVLVNESEKFFLSEKAVVSLSNLKDIQVAIVTRRERYNGFFERMMRKNGINIVNFFSEREAFEWLQGRITGA